MAFDSSTGSGRIVFKGNPLTLDQFAKIVQLSDDGENRTMVTEYDSFLVLRDLVDALDNPEGLEISIVEPTPTDWGNATFFRNGEELYKGGLEDTISLVDAARILHGVGDLEVVESYHEESWSGSEVGGCSTFYSPHYEQHTDSVTALGDAKAINDAIIAGDVEKAGELILEPLLRNVGNIKDEAMRGAIAGYIYSNAPMAMMDSFMSAEDIERVMNDDCGFKG